MVLVYFSMPYLLYLKCYIFTPLLVLKIERYNSKNMMKTYRLYSPLQVFLVLMVTLHITTSNTVYAIPKSKENVVFTTLSELEVKMLENILKENNEETLAQFIDTILCVKISQKNSTYLYEIVDKLSQGKKYVFAEKLLRKVLVDAIASDDSEFIQAAAIKISNLYLNVGDYEKASHVLLESLAYGENTSQYAEVLNQLGILQATNRNYELAEKYFKQALAESQVKKNIEEQIRYTTNLALNLLKLNNQEQATELFAQNRSLISNHAEFSSYLIGINHNEALLALSKNDYETAYEKLNTALELTATYEVSNQKKILIQTMLARAQRMLGKYKEAEEGLLALVAENENEDDPVNLVNIYVQLSYLYDATGDFKKAYQMLRTSNKYWFKMMSSNKQDEILNLNFKYNLNENQREIEFLKKEKAYKNEQLILQRNQLIYITSFAIILILFLIFIYRNQLKIKRKNKIINTKNDELYDLNEMLATLNSEKDNFMNLVAHDLKNPLINIQLCTDLHQGNEHQFAPDTNVFFQIREEAGKGLKLIKDLLNSHFIEEFSRKEIAFSKENLNTMVLSILKSNQATIQQKRLDIHTQLAEDTLMLVETKPIILTRILENLISNALKYSFVNDRVNIATGIKENHHYFSVTDTGGGIDTHEESILFDKFATISSKPKGMSTSSGIGLAACKILAEKINVDLLFTNIPNVGMTFTVLIKNQV